MLKSKKKTNYIFPTLQAKLKNSLIKFKIRTINNWSIRRDVLALKMRYRKQLNPSDLFETDFEKRKTGRDVLTPKLRYRG
jgi:hypothetical protein